LKFLKTISQTSAIQTISVIFEFAASVILVRYLGPLSYGIYTAVFIIPNLVTGLGAFGIGPSVIYFSGRRTFNLWAIFYFALISALFLSILYLIILYASSGLIYEYVFTERIELIYILIASLIIPLNLFNKFSRAILRGLGKVNAFTLSSMLLPTLIRFILILIFIVLLEAGLEGAILIPIFSVFTSSLVIIALVIFYLRNMDDKSGILRIDQIKEFLAYGLKFWIGSAIKKSDSGIMLLIVTYFSSLENLAFFKLGHSLANLSAKAKAIIDIVSVSKIVNSDVLTIKNQFPQVLRFIVLLIICLVIAGNLLIKPTIEIVYGIEFRESINIFRILLPALLLLQYVSIANQVKAYTGDPLYVSKVRSFGLFTNITLLLILVPYYSIYGASVSILVANLIMFFVSVYFMRSFFEISVSDLILFKKKDLNLINEILLRARKKLRA
tara:strand:+ start:20884 stop:22209 length:1326 start_codon:yes stop_codon:yes gene_type:complete